IPGSASEYLRCSRHLSPGSHFTRLFWGVIGIIGGAVVAEAVGEVILAQVGELRRTAVTGIVDRVKAADRIVPMVGSAAGAAIPQITVVDTAAGAHGLFLFVEVRLASSLLLHRLFHDRLRRTDLIIALLQLLVEG